MKEIFNIANLYTFLWLLLLVMPSSRLTALLLASLLLVSMYYWVLANTRYEMPSMLKALNVFIVMIIIYGIIMLLGGEVYYIREGGRVANNIEYIQKPLQSLLPIYAFYVFTRKGLIKEISIRWWTIAFLLVGIYCFYNAIQQYEMIRTLSMSDEFTNNTSYLMLALFPCALFFYKKPLYQYIILGICIFFIISGFKRGASLIGALCLILIIWDNIHSPQRGTKNKSNSMRWILTVAISITIIYFTWYIIDYYSQTSDYFQYRIEQTVSGEGGARNTIYNQLIKHYFKETNLAEFLFGMGANGTLKVTVNFAHNDWLEIATDNGLLGLVIYVVFLYRFYIRSKKYRYPNLRLAFRICFIIYTVKTFFSMSYADVPIFMSCAIGVCLGFDSMAQKET